VDLHREDLEALAAVRTFPCVSLFLPIERAGREVRQNPIRFKNLIGEAKSELAKLAIEDDAAERCLAAAHDLIDDDAVWSRREEGLAVFAADGFLRWHRLPFAVDERVMVGHRFHLKPLLPLLGRDEGFYVLAVSQNSLRLFAATRDSAVEMPLPDVPKSVVDAVGRDFEQEGIQARAGSSGAAPRTLMIHGQGKGGDDDVRKRELTHFLEIVDAGICRALADRQRPLVVAAVEYVSGIYRQLSGYKNLVAESIDGNPEPLSGEELRDRALPLVEPIFRQPRDRAYQRFRDLLGTERVTSDLEAAIGAALDGRVESTFLTLGQELWGTVDVDARRTEIHQERRPGDEDLLDRLAVETLKTAGAVYAVTRDEMPADGATAAAVMRY